MWFLAPLLSIAIVFYGVRAVTKTNPKGLWGRLRAYKLLAVVLSFLASYALGTNTMGLIVAISGFNDSTLIIAVIAIFVGSFYFSGGALKRVAEELFSLRYSNALVSLLISFALVEIATLFGIPLSNTQILSGSIFGAGLSHRYKLLRIQSFLIVVVGWIIAPLLSFAIGLLL